MTAKLPALSLIPFFVLAALSVQYNGGLNSGLLFCIWVSIVFGAAALGPAAWLAKPTALVDAAQPESLLGQHHAPLFYAGGVLLYAVALACAAVASPLPGIALELGLVMALLPAGYLLTRATHSAGLPWHAVWDSFRLVIAVLAIMAAGERLLTGARAYTLFADPNALSGLFNVAVLTTYAALVQRLQTKGTATAIEALLLVLFSAALGCTGSLSGFLCLLATLPVLAIFAARKLPKPRAAQVLGAAAVALLIVFSCSRGTADTPTDKLRGLAQHSSFTVRLEMAHTSLAIYRDHAWYGSGLGSYKLYYPQYRGPLDTGTTGDLAHNDYVQFLQEGGPLLLGALLALGCLTLYGTAKTVCCSWRAGASPADLQRAAAGFALLALLLHAGMNFIFYVAPLALVFGVLLARLAPEPAAATATTRGQTTVFVTLIAAISIGLMATLGARSLFLALTTNSCERPVCQQLRSNLRFMKQLTSYLAGTQPTWLPARTYLVTNYLQTEQLFTDPAVKALWRQRAMRETLSLLNDAPELGDFYVAVADMLKRDASLVALFPAGLPHEPIALYELALAHTPQDLRYRLQLAKSLLDAKQSDAAHAVLFVDGMRYWNMAAWGDGGRMQLLATAIPVAVATHHCKEAQEMAEGLKVFLRLQAEAAAVAMPLPAPIGALPAPTKEDSQSAVDAARGCS